jgi:hypothetical protein
MEAVVQLVDDKTVRVKSHSEPKDGSTAGDVSRELRAGESVWGHSYEQWREMGEGSHEIVLEKAVEP